MTKSSNKLALIKGSKGGDEQRAPIEAADSLRSKQIAQVTDVISEGEIVGLRYGLRSVYLNETPLMNLDGTFNFKDVALQFRPGTSMQEPFEGVTAQEFEVPVSTQVKAPTPVIRTITDPSLNAVRVTLGFPQLSEQNLKNGDLNGTSVTIRIDLQTNGGGFVTQITDTIFGKTTSRFQKAYRMALTGTGPWDIRVVRVSPDSTVQSLQNATVFDSYTGMVEAKLSHPNSAMIHTRVDAANFSTIPSRAFHIRGLIVKVPTNYDPATRAYNGIWDGTFKMAWTDNPAWCFYDMITEARYGLGDFIPASSVDKWSLYSIAKYCDGLVPNGAGGMEPRFTCNLYLQTREDAFKVLQNMASIFRAITFFANGTITGMQDRPADAIAQYTNANVIDGEFTYAGSSLKQRHTVALVSWNDPNDFFRQKIQYVQDDADVAKYGIIETEVAAFGCSSQGQAYRFGKWILATERFATETIGFKAGIEGCALYPGAIFQTSDVNRAGMRVAGRILAVAGTSPQEITIDSPITFNPAHTYSLYITLSNGTLEKRTLYNSYGGLGTNDKLYTTTAFSLTPKEGAVWILVDENSLKPELWRTLGVAQGDNGSIEVSAIHYEPSLYDNIETGTAIADRPVSVSNSRPPMPTSLQVTVSQYRVDAQITGLRALLSWSSIVGKYRVSWRKANGQWVDRETMEASIDIEGVDAAEYEFRVVAVSAIGRESKSAYLSIDLSEGAAEAITTLEDLTGLALEVPYSGDTARIKWDLVPGALRYEVQVGLPGATFTPHRAAVVGDGLRFAYTQVDMATDGGPFRSLVFRVRAVGLYNTTSNWATLTAGNAQVGALQGIQITPGMKSVFFKCERPSDIDFEGIMVWLGTGPNFTPSASNVIYDGPGVQMSANSFANGGMFDPATTYYLKAGGYDAIGKDNMTISSSFVVNVLANAPDEDTITADMIKAGALTATKFASDLAPMGLYDTLPDPLGYTGPTHITVTSENGKLYFYKNGAWEAITAVPDIDPGSITYTDLDINLQEAYAIVTDPVTTPGSFAYQIAQVGDVAQETADGLASEINLRTEEVSYVGSLADTAIAGLRVAIKSQSTAAQAQVVRTEAMIARLGQTTEAAITSEALVRANETEALAETIDGLSATWNGDITAKINTYAQTVSTQFAAVSTRIDGLSATWNNDITAKINTYNQTVATQFSAMSTRIDGLSATWNNDITAKINTYSQTVATTTNALSTRIDGLSATWNQDITAKINTYAQTQTTALGAISTRIDGLSATWNADINSSINTYNQSVASQFSSQATSISNLSTTVGGHTTSISQQSTSINGLKARVEVKIDNNGVISGYALDSATDRNGNPTSAMKFSVDIFQIAGTGVSAQPIFEVNTQQGVAQIVLAGTRIKNGTITANAIAANTITANEIAANAITANAIAANSITTAKIAAGAITAAQIAAGAITTDILVVGTNGGIPGTMIKDGAISTAKLVAGSVTAAVLAANSVTADKIVVNSITSDRLLANTITADKIAAHTITTRNLILDNTDAVDPDPGFYDPSFWFPAQAGAWPAGIYVGSSDTWPVSRMLTFFNTISANGQGVPFKVERGAVYRYKVTLYKDPGATGTLAINLHIPGEIYHPLGIPRTGTITGWAPNFDFNAIPSGFSTYSGTLSGNTYDYMQYLINGNITGGGMLFAIQLVRAMDASLVVNGSITADKMSVNSLSAVSSNFGSVHVNAGGGLHGGAYSAYSWPVSNGTGFYVGPEGALWGNPGLNQYMQITADGQLFSPYFTIGANGAITITNANVVNPNLGSKSISGLSQLTSLNRANSSAKQTLRTVVASASGGKAPYTYTWALQVDQGGNNLQITNKTGDTTQITGYGVNVYLLGSLSCTAIDANGFSMTAEMGINVQYGSGQIQ